MRKRLKQKLMNHIKNIYALKNNFVLNMYMYIYIYMFNVT